MVVMNQARSGTVVMLRDVRKSFRRKGFGTFKEQAVAVLDGVSFNVECGEIFGLLGANGSGKSTLMRIVLGLLRPDSGSVEVLGLDAANNGTLLKHAVGRVGVTPPLYKRLSALDNLAFYARLYGLPARAAVKRASEIAVDMGFPAAKLNITVQALSRGEQQKISLARTLMRTPKILILDEPTSGFDPGARRGLHEFVKRLRQSSPITILLATHDMPEAEQLCDRLAILDNGRVVAQTSIPDLKSSGGSLEQIMLKISYGASPWAFRKGGAT